MRVCGLSLFDWVKQVRGRQRRGVVGRYRFTFGEHEHHHAVAGTGLLLLEGGAQLVDSPASRGASRRRWSLRTDRLGA
jgi:hypothetical protein